MISVIVAVFLLFFCKKKLNLQKTQEDHFVQRYNAENTTVGSAVLMKC
jgi:hypothetical protein